MTHDDMPEVLKECPFCGSDADHYDNGIHVSCSNSKCPCSECVCTEEEWNTRRVTPPEVDLEELRYAIAEVNKMQFRLDKHYDLFMKAAAAYLKERG